MPTMQSMFRPPSSDAQSLVHRKGDDVLDYLLSKTLLAEPGFDGDSAYGGSIGTSMDRSYQPPHRVRRSTSAVSEYDDPNRHRGKQREGEP